MSYSLIYQVMCEFSLNALRADEVRKTRRRVGIIGDYLAHEILIITERRCLETFVVS